MVANSEGSYEIHNSLWTFYLKDFDETPWCDDFLYEIANYTRKRETKHKEFLDDSIRAGYPVTSAILLRWVAGSRGYPGRRMALGQDTLLCDTSIRVQGIDKTNIRKASNRQWRHRHSRLVREKLRDPLWASG